MGWGPLCQPGFFVLGVASGPGVGLAGCRGAFRAFVRFALVLFCLFPLPLVVWEGLRFVFVALPGLFSNIFY